MKKLKKQQWEELLREFCDIDGVEWREWMTHPFVNTAHGDDVWATDGHAALMVDARLIPGKVKYDRLEKPLTTWADDRRAVATFTIDALRQTIDRCPKQEIMEVDEEEKECPECGGSGKVEWEYTASHGDQHWYEAEFDCPVCNGEGILEEEHSHGTGQYEPTDTAAIFIIDHYYRAYEFDRIILAAETLGIDTITITHTPEPNATEGIIFQLCEGVAILLMPFLSDEDSVRLEVTEKEEDAQ